MKKYLLGDLIFNDENKCEVIESFNFDELNNIWELSSIYPLSEEFENSYIEENINVNQFSSYVFTEISEEKFKKIKEEYKLYNVLSSKNFKLSENLQALLNEDYENLNIPF